MTQLMLDYQVKARPVDRLGIGLLFSVVAMVGALGVAYHDLVDAMDSAAAEAAAVERAGRERGAPSGRHEDKAARSQSEEIARANQVLREISVPWDALFKAIENAGGKDVTLLGLEPDAAKHAVKIVGEARNFAAALEYLRQLQLQPVLYDVHLEHHQVEQQDAEKPVRFTVVAGWEAKS